MSLTTVKYSCTFRENRNTSETLDYTFRSHKKTASENYVPGSLSTRHNEAKNVKNKQVTEKIPELQDYMDDLIKTWSLNIDVIENFIKISPDLIEDLSKINRKDQIEYLVDQCQRIKSLHIKKLEYIKSSSSFRGKLLIDMLVEEEIRRIISETKNGYEEAIEDLEEQSVKKDSMVNQNEKKFDEVEVYVQRECMTTKKYSKYKDFRVVPFLRENQVYSYQRYLIQNYINSKRENLNFYSSENKELFSASTITKSSTKKSTLSKQISEFDIASPKSKVTLNSIKLEKVSNRLINKVQLLESLIEHKKILKESLEEKQRLFEENNKKIGFLIRQSKMLTSRHVTKEIDFDQLGRYRDSITDDQMVQMKESLFNSKDISDMQYEHNEKRIRQLSEKISLAEYSKGYKELDSEIIDPQDIEAGCFERDKLNNFQSCFGTNISILDESFFNQTQTKKQGLDTKIDEKWDISIIHHTLNEK